MVEDWGLDSESGWALVHWVTGSVPASGFRSGSEPVPGLAQDSESDLHSDSATDSDSAPLLSASS